MPAQISRSICNRQSYISPPRRYDTRRRGASGPGGGGTGLGSGKGAIGRGEGVGQLAISERIASGAARSRPDLARLAMTSVADTNAVERPRRRFSL